MSEATSSGDPVYGAADLLRELRHRGAGHLASVHLRSNRRTIWSLTAGGSRFNLHRAFSRAPEPVLADLAVIARDARSRSAAYHAAAGRVARWPGVVDAIRALRRGKRAGGLTPGPCCATPEQREYLTAMYRTINVRRFAGRLPDGVPLRLSSRMRTRLGQMAPGVDDQGRRYPVEIALNADLMLAGNDELRVETLVHEMAHVADLLEHGEVGHGPTWRRIALRVGCEPRACTRGSMRRRPPGTPPSTRVPSELEEDR